MQPRAAIFSRVIAAALLLAGPASGAVADAGIAAQPEPGVSSYAPELFSEFLPQNAFDLVRRLPGFRLDEGDDVRGLSGAQGNLLINGRRPPRRGGSPESRLRAIRVEDVARLELVEAGARDYDMQGYALLLNVVTHNTTARRVNGRVEVEMRDNGTEKYESELVGASTGGRIEWEARFDLFEEDNIEYGLVRSSTAGSPFARLSPDRLAETTRRDWQIMSTLHFSDSSSLVLSALTERDEWQRAPTEEAVLGGTLLERNESAEVERFYSAEWRQDLFSDLELTALLTAREGEAESSNSLLDGGEFGTFASLSETGETAARADLRWQASPSLTVESGIAWAFNFLEGRSRATLDGVVQDVQGSNARVEETRSAVLTTLTWLPHEDMSLAVGGRIEQFSLDSSNSTSGTLSLTDIAPRADFNWDLPGEWVLRLSSSREVGQLNLGEFIADTNLDNALNTAGAETLEPERDWTYGAVLERRFGERDLFRIEAEARDVDNPVSRILLDDGSVVPANVGPETIHSVSAATEIDMSRFGLDGLSVTGSANRRWSERIDPLQGFVRETSGHADFEYRLGLRQEIADGRYVFEIDVEQSAPRTHFWLTQVRKEVRSPQVTIEAEWRHDDTWRSGLWSRVPRDEQTTIYVFDGVRSPVNGPVLVNRIEQYNGGFVSLWTEREVRDEVFVLLSLRTGRARDASSAVFDPFGLPADYASQEADNIPSVNVRLRFNR